MSRYPAEIQAALMFDRLNAVDLRAVLNRFLELEILQTGTHYNLVEENPGIFYRIYGKENDVMITLEALQHPANFAVFKNALSSPFTNMAVPNAEEMLVRSKSHILVGVHHGVIPPSVGMQFAGKLNLPQSGQSLTEYKLRLRLCGLMSLIVHDHASVSLVHWTTSDHLMHGEAFAKFAVEPAPSLLHIHPLLFQGGISADGKPQIEIKTHGVAPFLGREIHVPATPVPWSECLVGIFCFIAIATKENGYVIPDGNVFGPEGDELVMGVKYIEAGEMSGSFHGPLYQLDVVHAPKHNFTKPSYIPRSKAFDLDNPPPEVLERLGPDASKVLREYQETRKVAEAAGNSLVVKFDKDAPPPPPSPPGRAVFGKRPATLH